MKLLATAGVGAFWVSVVADRLFRGSSIVLRALNALFEAYVLHR